MNNKLSTTYFILMIAPLFFGCGGPVTRENKNKATASSLSLHVGNENYFIIDMKETVVAWTGSSVHGKHEGYIYISKGELMGGTVEVDMNTIEDGSHRSDNGLINHLKGPDFFDVKKFPFSKIAITRVA